VTLEIPRNVNSTDGKAMKYFYDTEFLEDGKTIDSFQSGLSQRMVGSITRSPTNSTPGVSRVTTGS
jgi:hypothetical protein